MTGFLIFLLALVCFALWLALRNAREGMRDLEMRVSLLEDDLHRLERDAEPAPSASQPPPLPSRLLASHASPAAEVVPPPILAPQPVMSPAEAPPILAAGIEQTSSPRPSPPAAGGEGESRSASPPQPGAWPGIEWENFLGAKLFAWIAGIAVFLAVVFFVKYAFERKLISPAMRVGIGYAVGLGLVIGGLRVPRERYAILAQTFCATGILVLYANSFAAHTYYGFFSMPLTFGLMTVFTAAAFFLAVKLDAQVIAVLGLLGGFLTPPLLSTGVDRALGLFGYLALLDAGLIAIALRKRWNYLVVLAAAATAFMQWSWVGKFFEVGKVHTGMSVFLGFAVMFVATFAVAHRRQLVDKWVSAASILMASMALAFALFLLTKPYADIAKNVGLYFGYVLVADLAFLALAWVRQEMRPTHVGAGTAVFLLLSIWTARYLTNDTLNAALAAYLVFAVLHTVLPLVLQRLKPSPMPVAWVHLYPPLALLLVLFPLVKLATTSLLVWPVVLLIDLVGIVIAILTRSLLAILGVFVLTVLATALWIFQLPAAVDDVPGMLVVIGGFAIFFMAAAMFAARKLVPAPASPESSVVASGPALTQEMFSQICSLAATLPFLLLTLVVVRLPLSNPALVFGVAALLLVLLLGMTRMLSLGWLPVIGLGSALVVEYAWHFNRFTPANATLSVAWYLAFSALLLVFPFLFRKHFAKQIPVWAASALALPLHFYMVHRAMKVVAPDFTCMGLETAALAVPCLLGLLLLARPWPADSREREAQVALFGAATLFFITLIFPIQFERQWITIGWALEGAALLWLFRHMPHPGLRVVGVALLVAAFVRLGLNPWVITGYGRTGVPLWNWYLYAYGIVSVCLLAGGKLLAPPRDRVFGLPAPPLFYTLGVILAFLLVNIEIADSFSPPGGRLVFHFTASLGQDMTYSLAWALFAFALLAVGFWKKNAPTRYAGMALLVVTLLKLFLHDVWQLGGLYRIGSLIGLAVVLTVVSLIYQRFMSGEALRKSAEPPPA